MIGRAETRGFLADKPVGWLWGVGGAMQRRLAADGKIRFRLIGVGADRLADAAEADLPTLFDAETGGPRRLAEAIDALRQRHGAQAVQRGRSLVDLPPVSDDFMTERVDPLPEDREPF